MVWFSICVGSDLLIGILKKNKAVFLIMETGVYSMNLCKKSCNVPVL